MILLIIHSLYTLFFHTDCLVNISTFKIEKNIKKNWNVFSIKNKDININVKIVM